MAKKNQPIEGLPACVSEFIELVVKKMRYRKKVRREVREELSPLQGEGG